jgi:hypothetical protein
MARTPERFVWRRGLAVWMWIALAAVSLACGPIGPIPGGALSGEVVEGPVDDWSFTSDIETVQLETRPSDPYSVNTWIYGEGDRLYLPTSLILGDDEPTEREWVRNVLEDDRVRLRIDGRIYPRRAIRVTDPAELEMAREKLMAKYDVESDDHSAAAWVFRLDSR